jgi:hypothetical protein
MQDIGSGSAIVNFNAPLTGLTAATLYHVRAVIVEGGSTTTYGADQTFTTAADVPFLPSWGWAGLGGAALLVALRGLPRHCREQSAGA